MSNYKYVKEAADKLMEVWKLSMKELGGELVCCGDSIDPNLVTLLGKLNTAMDATITAAQEQAKIMDTLNEKMQNLENMLSEVLRAQERAEKMLNRLAEPKN